MIHQSPLQVPVSTLRAWTVSPLPTTSTNCLSSDCCTARRGTASALSRSNPWSRTRTNWPATSERSRLSNDARSSNVPVAGIHRRTHVVEPPAAGSLGAVRQDHLHLEVAPRLNQPAASLVAPPILLVLRGGPEGDVHRIHLLDRGEEVPGPVTRAPTSSWVRPIRPSISARTTASFRSFCASS